MGTFKAFNTSEKGGNCVAYPLGLAFYPESACKKSVPQEVLKASLQTLSWLEAEQKSLGQLNLLMGVADSEVIDPAEQSVSAKRINDVKTGSKPGGITLKIFANKYSLKTYYNMFKNTRTFRAFWLQSDYEIQGQQGSDHLFVKEILVNITANEEKSDIDKLKYISLRIIESKDYADKRDGQVTDYDLEAAAEVEVRNVNFVDIEAGTTTIVFRCLDIALVNVDDLEVGASGAIDLYFYDKTASAFITATGLTYDSALEKYTATVPALISTNKIDSGLFEPATTDNFIHTPSLQEVIVA